MNKADLFRISALCFATSIISFTWNYVEREHRAKERLPLLQVELNQIAPAHGSVEIAHHSQSGAAFRTPQTAMVSKSYTSNASCGAILSHFDFEFAHKGWRYVRQRPFNPSREREYWKERYWAKVQCGGEGRYSIQESWQNPNESSASVSAWVVIAPLLWVWMVKARKGRPSSAAKEAVNVT